MCPVELRHLSRRAPLLVQMARGTQVSLGRARRAERGEEPRRQLVGHRLVAPESTRVRGRDGLLVEGERLGGPVVQPSQKKDMGDVQAERKR